MKKVVILLWLLLFYVLLVAETADSYPDRVSCRAKMDRMAEQFKAETGFVGTIRYNWEETCFDRLEGYFPNKTVTSLEMAQAKADTLFRILQPYMQLNLAQFDNVECYDRKTMFIVAKRQVISGFSFEDRNGVAIWFYNEKPVRIRVMNSSFPGLDFSGMKFMSVKKALRKCKAQIPKPDSIETKVPKVIWGTQEKVGDKEEKTVYHPCYRFDTFRARKFTSFYIDAVTGKNVGERGLRH